jgi:acetaldehyde dehydrogenase (acetylating)
MTTGMLPSMTLGPGGVGGAITGDNVNVQHMFNIKRLAYEITPPPEAALLPGSTDAQFQQVVSSNGAAPQSAPTAALDGDRIEEIVRRVLAELGQ